MYRRGASVRPFDMHGYKRVGSLTRAGSRMQVAGAAGAFYGNPRQLGIQLAGIVTTMVFSFIMTLILIVPLDTDRRGGGVSDGEGNAARVQILKATQGIGLRVTEEAEDIGLDISEHGESMVVAHNQVCPAHTRSRGTARARNACTARRQRMRARHASRAQSLARHCADACASQRGRQLCCSVTPIHVAAYIHVAAVS